MRNSLRSNVSRSTYDAMIKIARKNEVMLINAKKSEEQLKKYRYLKNLVKFYFDGDGVPQYRDNRPDIVQRADNAIGRISYWDDFGYNQVIDHIKNAWKNESTFRIALSDLR